MSSSGDSEGFMGLDEAAMLAARHHWVESRLFGVLGGWVATTSEPDAKLLFDRHSNHHAWRAQQWWDRLPVLADLDRAELVAAQGAGLVAAFDALAAQESTLTRLACTYRMMIPRLAASYERHRLCTSAVADSSVLRTLVMLSADVATDWLEGEAVLELILRTTAASNVDDGDGGGSVLGAATRCASSIELRLVEVAGL